MSAKQNDNKNKHAPLNEMLLLEHEADGALDTIFAPVKANLKMFGTILKDSAKLIGGDLGFLVKLTFGRLKSLADLQEMKKDNNRRRKDLLGNISKNSDALMDSWPGGKITSMMVAPGLFFTTTALSGMGKITSKEFRDEVGTYGLNQVPILGLLFGADPDREYQFQKDISRCEPGEKGAKCMDSAFARLSGSSRDSKPSGLSLLAQKINSIFLFAGHELEGSILVEGDDTDDTKIPNLSKEQYNAYATEIKKRIDAELTEARTKWIEGQKQYFDKIIGEATNVISLNTSLAATNDSKEFFAILEKLKQTAGEEMKDLDIEKIKTTFADTGSKLMEDEKSMEQIQKSFEEEGIEETQEALESKIEEIVLSSFKGTFLQEMSGALADYYDEVYTTISGGISADQKKVLIKDELGKEYMSMVDSYGKKLQDALSNLK
jgi:hypothetical protein